MENTSKEWVLTTDGEANFHGVCCDGNWLLRVQQNGELMPLQQEQNMKLIAEAGTVANETGKSPRELLILLEASERHANNLGDLLARTEAQNRELLKTLGRIMGIAEKGERIDWNSSQAVEFAYIKAEVSKTL
jgi:hypothetical protein